MKCLRPISVPNMSRFVNLATRHPLMVKVACGRCASCQQNKALEWYFRAYKHFEDCVAHNGYVYFDCLTYRDSDVPHIRYIDDFGEYLRRDEDFMCFNFRDVRLFHVRLRKKLSKLGYKKNVYDYFVASEYGTSRDCTHRPHYHILFFVKSDISPLVFSRLVSDSWDLGRTDGLPYKPATYVLNNVFRSMSIGGRRVCNYVSKYVQKKSSFQKTIDARIAKVISRIGVSLGKPDFRESDEAKQIRRRLDRIVGQFHRQSQFFGYSAIRDVDLDKLFDLGFFLLPNGKPSMFTHVPISKYYLRHLLYEKRKTKDGYESWYVRPDRLHYWNMRNDSIKRSYADSLSLRFADAKMQRDGVDFNKLSDYLLNWRGHLVADDIVPKLFDSVCKANLFVYASPADKNHFGFRFICDRYLGYRDNYKPFDGVRFVSCYGDFVEQMSCNQLSLPFFNGYDDLINDLENAELKSNANKQLQYEHLQHLKDVYDAFY